MQVHRNQKLKLERFHTLSSKCLERTAALILKSGTREVTISLRVIIVMNVEILLRIFGLPWFFTLKLLYCFKSDEYITLFYSIYVYRLDLLH